MPVSCTAMRIPTCSSWLFQRADLDQYVSLPGEFYGVAHKIHYDLADASGVTHELFRAIGLVVQDQLQALFLGFGRQ